VPHRDRIGDGGRAAQLADKIAKQRPEFEDFAGEFAVAVGVAVAQRGATLCLFRKK
jgi:hypothetical protein